MSVYTLTVPLVLTQDEHDFLMSVEAGRKHGLADVVASIIRDRMFHDTVGCEGCGRRVKVAEARGWVRTADDCDLCPDCAAQPYDPPVKTDFLP